MAGRGGSVKARSLVLMSMACVLVGSLLGAGSALIRSGQNQLGSDTAGTIVDGTWKTDFEIGSDSASGALRARVARKGLFALSRSEAVYYTRNVDNQGRDFLAHCTYRLSGGRFPAEWWSVTLYDQDSFLARNRDEAASINMDQVVESGGAWNALIGSEQPSSGGNWISTNGADTFDLTLRLYRPNLAQLMSGKVTGFPTLERLSCDEGSSS